VALTQLLVGACFGAVALQFLAAGEQFLLNDVAAASWAIYELHSSLERVLLDAGNRTGRHRRDSFDQAATITGPSRTMRGSHPPAFTTCCPRDHAAGGAAGPAPCCRFLQATPSAL